MSTFEEVATRDYFESYDNISVHNLMLRDKPRVARYREAIMASKNLIKDKIVLDVGCGTGVLSLFCAQAGARHVYGVEASPGIHQLAKSIVTANKLDDRITLINSEIEKLTSLPVDKVDVIVSEWMGFYLVHESMLDSVIYARDRWLRDGGLMMPSMAYLYVCPVEMTDYLRENIGFWSKYEGLNFSSMAKVYSQLLLEKPLVETIKPEQLVDKEKLLVSLDLKKCTREDLKIIQSNSIKFESTKDDSRLHGFAFWFDVVFRCDDDELVYLSTSPSKEPTHWKQTVAFLPDAVDGFVDGSGDDKLKLKKGDEFVCSVMMNQCEENSRLYQIDIGLDWIEDPDSEEEEDIKSILIKATLERYRNQATK